MLFTAMLMNYYKYTCFKCYNEYKQETGRLSKACSRRRNRVHGTLQKGPPKVRELYNHLH